MRIDSLATGNSSKLAEFERILGYPVRGIPLPIPEPQPSKRQLELMRSPSAYAEVAAEIASEKARAAFELNGSSAVFVEDSALFLDCLEGMPGPLIAFFSSEVTMSRLCQAANTSWADCPVSNLATAIVSVAVWDGLRGDAVVFQGVVRGRIAPGLRGVNGFGWDKIFIPDGEERTFAEMSAQEKDARSMRRLALHEAMTTPSA